MYYAYEAILDSVIDNVDIEIPEENIICRYSCDGELIYCNEDFEQYDLIATTGTAENNEV